MKKLALLYVMLLFVSAFPAFATVAVTAPANNSTVGTSVAVQATTSTTCSRGISASGIYIDDSLVYTVGGNVVNTTVGLSTGKHKVVIQGWDYCGGATTAALSLTSASSSSVSVSSPAEGATVSTTVPIVATATSTCAKGVSAMGVYVNSTLVKQVSGSSLNASVTLGVGKQSPVIQQWDYCGGSTSKTVNVNVTGTAITGIQNLSGWNQWGQMAPAYQDCDLGSCNGLTWSMAQNQSAVSLSGAAAKFTISGTTPYADVLFSNPVIGQGNKQGLTDADHTLLPTLHNFQLDQDVYITNWAVTQDLEFDINWYGNKIGMEFGTECNHLNGNVWDYWDNVNATWVHTSIPCNLVQGAWNHVTVNAQRLSNNYLLYQSITVNGTTYALNITVPPMAVPASWWGMTVNYQMDGDYAMHTNTTYVDNMKFTYW
jgi:hypothetical protein